MQTEQLLGQPPTIGDNPSAFFNGSSGRYHTRGALVKRGFAPFPPTRASKSLTPIS